MNDLMKSSLKHLLAIVFFLALTLAYFYPSIIEGKAIPQGDMINSIGMSEELRRFYEEEGVSSAWTNAMFSGMPSYNIYVFGNPPNYLSYATKIITSIDYMGGSIVLCALIFFYILMCTMGVNRWLSIAGAIAFAFASYNFIIIMAGHITKAYAIAYMPLTIAGMLLLARKKWLWGWILTTLGITYSLMSSHIQVTYYLAVFCLFLYLGFLVKFLSEKDYAGLTKKSGLLVCSVILAVLPSIGSLYTNHVMSKESTRGPSELSQNEDGATKGTGLDRDYAFQWSYGRAELLTLLIPNAFGGESGGFLDNQSELYKVLRSKGAQVGEKIQTYTYWGEQMFTEGPVYFGAVVCFLFVLGMFVIRNKIKYWMLAGAVFFTLLALGHHLAFFNFFLFDHLPLYNKFRTPSMALIIPGLVFPIIGIWGLKEIFEAKADPKTLKRGFLSALSVCGGICLIVWLVPGLFLDFQSVNDAQAQMPDWYLSALIQDRSSLASSDAFRSLVFILLAAGLLYYFIKAKNKKQAITVASVGLMVLILTDLWTVNKRYLNNDSFSSKQLRELIPASVANKEILKDTSPSFRVLNLQNTFQESRTSFFHKSIGGYHAAKLRRYQDLIDHRLSKEISGEIISKLQQAQSFEDLSSSMENTPSLNMLNARYVIFNPEQPPFTNPYALGNAWFVESIRIVDNPDEEIASLDSLQPAKEAVTDKRFQHLIENLQIKPDSTASIQLDTYLPNKLTYTSETQSEQLAVFSEVYFANGWNAYIDGEWVPHLRVNWTLRALPVPAGKHTIEFRFEPATYRLAVMVASVSSGIILLLLLGAIVYGIKRRK